MKTDEFIERLARSVDPVTPLHRPWLRATTWLVGAFVYIGALTVMMTSSGDLTATEIGWRILLPQIAAIAVSATAAAAAFASVIPGASPRVLLWPAAAVVVWLGGLVLGPFQEWQAIGTIGLAPQREWLCVAILALGGALPALGMALMLRHGAPLTPRVTTALAVLAAAASANVGACVSHPHTSRQPRLTPRTGRSLSSLNEEHAKCVDVLAWNQPRADLRRHRVVCRRPNLAVTALTVIVLRCDRVVRFAVHDAC